QSPGAGHAMVEVLFKPVSHLAREQSVRTAPGRISHRISRLQPAGVGIGEPPDELRRVHLRSGDHGAGGASEDAHRRDSRAYAVLRASVVGLVRTEPGLWFFDPVGAGEVSFAQMGHSPATPVREPGTP